MAQGATRLAEHELQHEWVHVQYAESAQFTEVYGFSGSQGKVNLEGVRMTPKGRPSRTLALFMHPSSTLQLLPVPQALARAGVHVLCAGSRYARNDTPLIMEKVALDLGAYIRHAKESWGYERVVLAGWSGGGSLVLFYQSQAERPTIRATPAGDPVNLAEARLPQADGVVLHAAHLARSITLAEWIDPSVLDEDNPDQRNPELDIYDPANPVQPPYPADYVRHYREAQHARMRRRTAWVREKLETLRKRGGAEMERGFVTHRTMADLRFMDPAVDTNDRKPRWCYLGNPETANSGPAGLARYSTLRSWLSQWSLDDSQANGPQCAASVSVPLLAIENSADDAVPQPDTQTLHDAAGSKDRTLRVIKGGTHYYQGQPDHLREAVALWTGWLAERNFLD